MDILIAFARTLFVMTIAFFLYRWGTGHRIPWLKLRGRVNRSEFAVRLVTLSLVSYFWQQISGIFLDGVVVLASYWAVKAFAFLRIVILTPFYYSLYVGRFHDFSFPGIFGFTVVFCLVFATSLAAPKPLDTIFTGIILVLNLLLLVFPGTKGRNPYGPQTHRFRRMLSRKK